MNASEQKAFTTRARASLAQAILGVFVFGVVGGAAAQATNYPSRPIKLIVPFPPGGPTDVLGRVVAQKLSEQWSQPVIVENRGGAGGTIGISLAAKAPADGYTLVMGGSSNLAVAPNLYPKLAYDPLRDLTPVANVASGPYVLAVHVAVPAKNVSELVRLAKSKKGLLSYGSAGKGSNSHLAGELLRNSADIDIVEVQYRGAAALVTGVLVGEIDIIFADFPALAPAAKEGKLRLLAAIGSKRLTTAPQLPTMIEAGVPDYAIDVWFGIMAPAGTPNEHVAKLNAAIVSGLKTPDLRRRFQTLGYEAIGGTPEHFAATIRADIEKSRRIVKKANITIE